MQATYEDLDIMLEVQQIDLAIMQAKKARAALPQRIQVMKVRKKRAEIEPKLQQVIELQKESEAEITKVEDEDRGLAEKQERAQEEIDNANSDYRRIESRSKEMAGVVKRRVTLEERLIELNAEHDKIKAARSQLENAIEACDKEEVRLREAYQEEDAALVNKAKLLLERRAGMVAKVSPELVERYDQTAAKAGGVALGKLEGNVCGVCRTNLAGGHLIDLKNQAPLGVCPSCKRLLVIEE